MFVALDAEYQTIVWETAGWTMMVILVDLGQDQEVVGVVVVRGAVGHELLLCHHPVLVCVHVGKHLSINQLKSCFRHRCHDAPNHNWGDDTYKSQVL